MRAAEHSRATPSGQAGHGLRATICQAQQPVSLSNDLRLFAMTFAGGFLFMAIYLA